MGSGIDGDGLVEEGGSELLDKSLGAAKVLGGWIVLVDDRDDELGGVLDC